MKTRKFDILVMGIVLLCLFAGSGYAQTPATDEEALFTTTTAPDALILFDLSGSMLWNPAGDDNPYGASTACVADTTHCTGSGCTGGFCGSSKSGCNIDCSRLTIAKRVVFSILDDNNDNTINSTDEGSLGVRIGYMRFYNCDSSSEENSGTYNYSSGCSTLIRAIGSKYSLTYCANSTSCTITSGSSSSTCVNGESAVGGTPLASSMEEAKRYLDAHKALDVSKNCRQKFVILLTDGSDTYACGADGSECAGHRYKNRREVVAKAKQLADAGYKIFVIGFGSTMPPYLQNTLNWMAYYGGTDDPNVANTGSTSAYNITSGCDPTTSPVTNPTACCNTSTNAAACYPAGVTGCAPDSAAVAAACYDDTHPYPGTGASTSNYRASANDPGYLTLSGYAFLAADADALALAMRTAINIIREATYSFSQASVQAQRTQDENFLFEGSFQPVSGDSFWLGHLRKFNINADGTVGSSVWDAGTLLQTTAASSRTIKTYKAGSLIDFNTTNITAADLGVADTAHRDAVVGYVRGETAYNSDNWKLGDVFRSTPMTVGTPPLAYDDFRDTGNKFAAFRTDHVRASAKGNRLIVAGANDGQMHAFKTSDGREAWSFIPPNLLSKLKTIAHATEPTTLAHMYFVDGPVTVANVWLGSSSNDTSKAEADWHTLMIFGEGRGGGATYLWSSSQYCDSGFSTSGSYSATYPYYCGYYALDVTGANCVTTDASCTAPPPVFRWRLGGSAASMVTYGPYLSEPWSKVMVGRVLINGYEKWVGFVGGGGGSTSTKGNGFFIIDLSDGSILRGFTPANDSNMVYGMLAGPTTVDSDRDGFVDTVYLGDRGGNMWRFKLCLSGQSTCNATTWTATRLFNAAGSGRPIFAGASAAWDTSQNLWVYWGTGDKLNETLTTTQDMFYALKDNDRTTTYTSASLQNVSSTTYTDTSKYGWYINLSLGEKALANPTVFNGVLYFTTYLPPGGTDPCAQGGTASLYALMYMTGGGAIPTTGDRKITLAGGGIPSAPIISLRPDTGVPDIYATTSGAGMTAASTAKVPINLSRPGASMIYWRDMRVQ